MENTITVAQLATILKKNLPNVARRDVCRDWVWLVGEVAYDLAQITEFDREAFFEASGYNDVARYVYRNRACQNSV